MKKFFAAVLVAVIAGLGWYFSQPAGGSSGGSQAAAAEVVAGSSDAGRQAEQVSTTVQKTPQN